MFRLIVSPRNIVLATPALTSSAFKRNSLLLRIILEANQYTFLIYLTYIEVLVLVTSATHLDHRVLALMRLRSFVVCLILNGNGSLTML